MRILIFIVLFGLLITQDDFEIWKQQQNQAFQQYVDQFDSDFADFLDREWTSFEANQGMKRELKPKPRNVPIVEEEVIKVIPGSPITIEAIPAAEPESQIDFPEPEPILVPSETGQRINVALFDQEFIVPSDLSANLVLPRSLDNHAISDAWLDLSREDSKNTRKALQSIEHQYRLNDWAFGALVQEFARTLYRGKSPESAILTWHLLVKLGFDVKVGHTDSDVILLTPTQQEVYEIPYFTIDGKRYYANVFDRSGDRVTKLKTYNGSYPQAEGQFSLRLTQLPEFTSRKDDRNLSFTYHGEQFSPRISYETGYLSFYQQYPQTEMELYFSSKMSAATLESLTESLRPILQGKSQGEALNVLLRFIQTAFEYKTDGDQFGFEKPMFADETIHYPYCDCEDRSVLFAQLASALLDVPVIGLRYPGHIAAAVQLSGEKIQGDYISYHGVDYLVCDPTFINADIGRTMPKYAAVTPEVIEF